MFREMRRKDRQLSTEDAENILQAGTYGILSTLGEDGYTYGVPLSYAYDHGKIYFHGTSDASHKKDNIAFHSKVSFTVVDKTEVLPSQFSTRYESVIVFGTIQECEDKLPALHKILEKYSVDFLENGKRYANAVTDKVTTYVLTIDHISGKARRN